MISILSGWWYRQDTPFGGGPHLAGSWLLENAIEAGGEVGLVSVNQIEGSGGGCAGAEGNQVQQDGGGLDVVFRAGDARDLKLEQAVGRVALGSKAHRGVHREEGRGGDAFVEPGLEGFHLNRRAVGQRE